MMTLLKLWLVHPRTVQHRWILHKHQVNSKNGHHLHMFLCTDESSVCSSQRTCRTALKSTVYKCKLYIYHCYGNSPGKVINAVLIARHSHRVSPLLEWHSVHCFMNGTVQQLISEYLAKAYASKGFGALDVLISPVCTVSLVERCQRRWSCE